MEADSIGEHQEPLKSIRNDCLEYIRSFYKSDKNQKTKTAQWGNNNNKKIERAIHRGGLEANKKHHMLRLTIHERN